jgi:hypothetical protein
VEGFTHTQAFKSFLAAYAPADMSRPARTKAKKEWDALDDDTDLAAVIEAAKAWQASWARQGRPDAPRKSAAAWLHDELYLKPAPKGFTKVEKARKAKADTKARRPTDVRVAEETAPPNPTKRFLTAAEEAEREFLEAWIAEQDAA